MIIGIDNALSGGLAAISLSHGLIIAKTPMPVAKRPHIFEKTKRRKVGDKMVKVRALAQDREIDAIEVVEWIRETSNYKACPIVIEECPEHAQQKATMRSMAISYGILVGALSAALPSYRLVIVRSGNPKDSWQRAMLGPCEKGETKAAALAAAERLWPEENWLASERCKSPHDGMIDSALIAQFARISNL
jgi:hypothetical protein